MTNEVQKIIDEGAAFGFTVIQEEWGQERGEITITQKEPYDFYNFYKVKDFNWAQVIKDYAWEAHSVGINDGQRY